MLNKNRIIHVAIKTVVLLIIFAAVAMIDSIIGSTIGAEVGNSIAVQQMNNDAVSSYGIIMYQNLQNFKPCIVIAAIICVYLNDVIYLIKKVKGE